MSALEKLVEELSAARKCHVQALSAQIAGCRMTSVTITRFNLGDCASYEVFKQAREWLDANTPNHIIIADWVSLDPAACMGSGAAVSVLEVDFADTSDAMLFKLTWGGK